MFRLHSNLLRLVSFGSINEKRITEMGNAGTASLNGYIVAVQEHKFVGELWVEIMNRNTLSKIAYLEIGGKILTNLTTQNQIVL